MAHLSTGGEQAFHRAEGSWTGCSLSAKERARPLPDRPTLTVERRVFCLRCGWSTALTALDPGALRRHLEGHQGAGTVCGVDWARGHRYGPLEGKRGRGKGCPLPALRLRSGRGAETAEAKARRIRAGLATRRRLARERAAAGNAAAGPAVG